VENLFLPFRLIFLAVFQIRRKVVPVARRNADTQPKTKTMTKSFKNAINRAEGTIARASGGRRSWDSIALCETALSALRGEKAPCGGSMSPEECDRMMSAFRVIADRTSRAHRFEAEQF
jgi:hypothetical protein